MRKIATLFDRDWDSHRGVIPELSLDARSMLAAWGHAATFSPTEKLDGANIRLTVRSRQVVRTEKRRNPTKDQKKNGIVEPWYTDTSPNEPADAYLLEAAANASGLPYQLDGEYPAEAIGPKIQGNPLGLESHQAVVLFEGGVPLLTDFVHSVNAPPAELFDYVRSYLATARSALNPKRPIEGIVWHAPIGALKIKAKDFKGEHAIEPIPPVAAG